jgi:chemotaxis protein MotB
MSHGGGDSGRWLVSYADLVTLLWALFLVLWTLGQTDIAKYRALAEAFREAFNGGGRVQVVDAGISSGAGTGESRPNPVNPSAGFPPRTADTMDVASDLSTLLNSAGLGNSVSVQNNIEGILLSLSEELLFEPGRADLMPTAVVVLDQIADLLRQMENPVRVTAYTDDTPPADTRFPTNWELSAARSAAIVRYLVTKGIAPERLSATGAGEYRPLFPNTTPENRTLNRRAEIAVIYNVERDSVVLGANGLFAAPAAPSESETTP